MFFLLSTAFALFWRVNQLLSFNILRIVVTLRDIIRLVGALLGFKRLSSLLRTAMRWSCATLYILERTTIRAKAVNKC